VAIFGDPDRLRAAAARFVAFFEELREAFVERDDVVRQIALALLSREHVLMTGPPGTAKSRLASATLARIVDEGTGQPTLFTRQFTESTVQTDLVGSIDFKTLMETGRTEHFTDEGMLGAVHAFLDEVFDGRDMLLRSALNVLHERELKQGTRTTRGHIECALMTSNRYLAEILEGSRETLLAFVDRIAFVSFVPRAFSNPAALGSVLRAQVAGTKPPPLAATLTIQDLDALQAAVESVFIADEVCDLLVALLDALEQEMAAAVRADPTFIPTRYLSTRTAVRLGCLLRAICVYDWAFGGRQRPFSVTRDDFRQLYTSLVLCGPSPEQVKALLERETDPRERRQLGIMRTEREIFDHCLARLPAVAVRPQPPAVTPDLLRLSDPRTLGDKSEAELLGAAHRLATAATLGDPHAERAASRLQGVLAEVLQRAFRHGLAVEADQGLAPVVIAERLAELADQIEASSLDRRSVARWLRGQALGILHETVGFGVPALGAALRDALAGELTPSRALAAAEARMGELERLMKLRDALRNGGAEEKHRDAAEAVWQTAIVRLEEDLEALWDEALRRSVASALSELPADDLTGVVASVREPLMLMERSQQALDALGGSGKALRQRVVAPRLGPVVCAAFERFDTSERQRVAQQVEHVLVTLRDAGLEDAIAARDLLTWTARALLRSERKVETEDSRQNFDGYRELRRSGQRMSLAYALAELCLTISRSELERIQTPAELLVRITEKLGEIPEAIRADVAASDLERIARPVTLLEGWWQSLLAGAEPDADAELRRLSESRFFHVVRDEGALVRFALEARLLAELLPGTEVQPLRARIELLDETSLRRVRELLGRRNDAQWSAILSRPHE
jgi:MoxR-like ATPase